ncbi:hypothetical protein F2Q69_00000077 [Brassica cretica]|uniref:Uncharacterized protein n=1 Tax=Brassica cretica TaxID=69181 RepID=A0A8S9P939_BRACR|nr:hypothetical protein F2Q69_00000077 [Brassica cretica]
MMTVVVHWAPINVGTISYTCVCSVQAIKVCEVHTRRPLTGQNTDGGAAAADGGPAAELRWRRFPAAARAFHARAKGGFLEARTASSGLRLRRAWCLRLRLDERNTMMGLDARDSQRLRSYGRFTKTAETKLKNMAVSGYLWLRMMVVASSTVWRVVAPATSSGELSPFFFFFSLSLSLSLSFSFLILKKMEVVGKKVEMVEKKLEVVGLEKEVEMVGVVGHYRNFVWVPASGGFDSIIDWSVSGSDDAPSSGVNRRLLAPPRIIRLCLTVAYARRLSVCDVEDYSVVAGDLFTSRCDVEDYSVVAGDLFTSRSRRGGSLNGVSCFRFGSGGFPIRASSATCMPVKYGGDSNLGRVSPPS